jgi:hypothetical protein
LKQERRNIIRDVAVVRDGAVWIVEDASPGRAMRMEPDGGLAWEEKGEMVGPDLETTSCGSTVALPSPANRTAGDC